MGWSGIRIMEHIQMRNWIKHIFSRSKKLKTGWVYFHLFDTDGNLLLFRKHGSQDYNKWEPHLVATAKELELAKHNSNTPNKIIFSRNDFDETHTK
jgi:hypothetical protein